MSSQPLSEYFSALERLKTGRTTVVPKGTKITNDAVALEAGRGKGSIKKSRPAFAELIKAIDEAAAEQSKPKNEQKVRLNRIKMERDSYRCNYESALNRELSLLYELYEVKKKLSGLTGEKVLPLRGGGQHYPQ